MRLGDPALKSKESKRKKKVQYCTGWTADLSSEAEFHGREMNVGAPSATPLSETVAVSCSWDFRQLNV